MNIQDILKRSKRAAARAAYKRAPGWVDDVAQEAAIEAWLRLREGKPVSYRLAALKAITKIDGDVRNRETESHHTSIHRIGSDDLPTSLQSQPSEMWALARWRLERLWPDLTDTQKAALPPYLCGGQFPRGADYQLIAAKRACERINNPGQFKRAAKKNVRQMTREEKREYDRWVDQRYRERQIERGFVRHPKSRKWVRPEELS